MKIKMYQIDAFAERVFQGNPAAVCILEEWIDDTVMQNIAGENNLAETAFVVKVGHLFEIRWFTPTVEVDLCGHATLAAAYVLFSYFEKGEKEIQFFSPRSGILNVILKQDGEMTMDFPCDQIEEMMPPHDWTPIFGVKPVKTIKGKTDYLLIYPNQAIVEEIVPDLVKVAEVDCRGIIVSAAGDQVDFVSRFFAPQSGVDEDPVTGSAHTTLTPYWSEVLGKKEMSARQLSKRSGTLRCVHSGDRVEISGKAVPYLMGEIEV